jgi:hypothetical protein
MKKFVKIYLLLFSVLCIIYHSALSQSFGNASLQLPLAQANLTVFDNFKSILAINGTEFDKMERKVNFGKKAKRLDTDSNEAKNIIKVWENSSNDVVMSLKLKEPNQRIKISVWNMLGKNVIDDFDGEYKNLESEHIIRNSNNLPKGVYLIIVQGEKVRLDSKFIISR